MLIDYAELLLALLHQVVCTNSEYLGSNKLCTHSFTLQNIRLERCAVC
jgi:hypothetical protein